MCGIAGYIRPRGLLDQAVLDRMTRAIAHRGPDGHASWTDPRFGLALTHTRLAVQDLTEAAEQPMRSENDAQAIVFNGEIYNFRELREQLIAGGTVVRSTGDTEVLFHLCRRDASLGFLPRLNGMFAFACWDAATRSLTLVRDRTGVKPLLYAELPGGGLAFASEMKALRPLLEGETIDPTAVRELLTLGFIAAPRTIFHQVKKLRPGQLLRWRDGEIAIEDWAPLPPRESPVATFDEAKALIREKLSAAVGCRLLADVPVGVFLSGGIDSAIVTALSQKLSSERVRTFSVSFPGQAFYDESKYAAAVATMHGTDHTVLPLTLDDIRDVIPTVQAHIGEPFADSSVLPTYLLSKLTRQHVTVALSGDGADELFGGYNRYAAATLMERYGWFSRSPLYGVSRKIIEALPARRETKLGSKVSMMKRAIRSMDSRDKWRYGYWMRTSDDATYARLLHEPAMAPRILEEIVDLLWQYRGEPRASDDLNNHLRTEWRLSLPDDMLTKVDLASMAHGLEVRSPMLDYRLVDAVMPMDWRWKVDGYRKKRLLIEAFRDELPPELHNRSKKGFEVPVGVWLRGPLYEFARDLIDSDDCFFGTILSREGARSI
ncbi:MAG TPA: asparagine synthase (glutamine-hydrolyzing), partial [Phycisphaerae bacterium]|nr:asparagine synthase (glutamine-hydrolyzing) [Phycisphaerae bacterium]